MKKVVLVSMGNKTPQSKLSKKDQNVIYIYQMFQKYLLLKMELLIGFQ
jgi:hypothetical protein